MQKMTKPAPKRRLSKMEAPILPSNGRKLAKMSLADLKPKEPPKILELINNKQGCFEKYSDGSVVEITEEQWRVRLVELLGKEHGQPQSA